MSRLGELIGQEELSNPERSELRRLVEILEQQAYEAAQVVGGNLIKLDAPIETSRAIMLNTTGSKQSSLARGLQFRNAANGSIVGLIHAPDDSAGVLNAGVRNPSSQTNTRTYISWNNNDNGRVSVFCEDDEVGRFIRNASDENIQELLLFGGSNGGTLIGSAAANEIILLWGRNGETVFNDAGRDIDFRVESDTLPDAFTVDGGTNQTIIGGFFNLKTISELTIASGAITVTGSRHTVDTESDAATDDLDTISGGNDGDILVLQSADAARDPTLKDSVDNLRLAGDFTLTSPRDKIFLMNSGGTIWHELSRSDNE